jgi:hypothetical protein
MAKWCEHCDQPMGTTGRFPVSRLSRDERRTYRHNGRVAVVPRLTGRGDFEMCDDCARMVQCYNFDPDER